MLTLRPYQETAIAFLLSGIRPGGEESLIAATGAGKTIMAIATIQTLISQGHRVWVIVNREALLRSWQRDFYNFDRKLARQVGVIADGFEERFAAPIQICMMQTLIGKVDQLVRVKKLCPSILVMDEAHTTGFGSSYERVRFLLPRAMQINLTATPCRNPKDKHRFEHSYPKKSWHLASSIPELIQAGVWKTPKWIYPANALLDETKLALADAPLDKNGDYQLKALREIMIPMVDRHIDEWEQQGGGDRRNIWFCCDRTHAKVVTERLKKRGHRAALILGNTKSDEREAIYQQAERKVFQIVSVGCLTYGFDLPAITGAVILRPTRSWSLWFQMIGRALRRYKGQPAGYLHDLVYNSGELGYPEEVNWLTFVPYTDDLGLIARSAIAT
jgi:DNA repair protein RadD